MGSSSVSCVLTGATLANEPAVLIPLAPARYIDRNRPTFSDGSTVVSNEGSCGNLTPLTLPIFGEVGDYGTMEEFIPDPNTEYLTRKMGGPEEFKRFLECVARGGTVPYIQKVARKVHTWKANRAKSWHGNLRGCWVSRVAWDKFTRQILDDDGSDITSAYIGSWVTGPVLKGMGFLRGKKDVATATSIFGPGVHSGDRYNIPYTHPELPSEFVVWCDGYMSCQASYKGKSEDIRYRVKDLHARVKALGLNFPLSSLEWAKSHTMFHPVLLGIRSQRAKTAKLDRLLKASEGEKPLRDWEQIKDNFSEGTKAELHRRFQASLDLLKDPNIAFKPLDQDLGVDYQDCYVRVFCNQKSYGVRESKGKFFHVTTTTRTLEGDPISFEVADCTCSQDDVTSRDHYMGLKPQFKFSEDIFEALAAKGCKKRKITPMLDRYGYDDVHLRGFAPEMAQIYHGKILTPDFLPLTEALLMFDFTMGACNRLFQPTNGGWQCGNLYMQREVAKMSWKLASDKMKARARWR